MKHTFVGWMVLLFACGGSEPAATSASAAPPKATTQPVSIPVASASGVPAARHAPTCVKPVDKTCVEAMGLTMLNAEMCDGKFSNDGCPRERLLGTCTRYGKGPLESTAMLRDFFYAGTSFGANAADLRQVCEDTNGGLRGKGVFEAPP
jgi:hypothetical protein